MAPYTHMALGVLNMLQLMIGPAIFFLVTTANQHTNLVVLRVDSLFMVWVSGTFFTLSLFLFACCILDNTLPLRSIYRTTTGTATMCYALCAILFTTQELTQGHTMFGRVAAALSVINSFAYIASAVISYQPTIV
ncbi:hypothetical protein MTO96_005331 [Rhipicephalus appendiculatus]